MSTAAHISLEQYETMVGAGVFTGKHHQRVELIHGNLRDRGAPTPARISFEQYEMMIEAGVFSGKYRQRMELVHGELRMMTPIGARHANAVDQLNLWAARSLDLNAVRIRIQQPIGLPESESELEPDVALVTAGDYGEHHPRASDVLLIIEVAEGSLQYDCGEKADLYAAAGIEDYWVIDLAARCVRVFRQPADGKYQESLVFRDDAEVSSLKLVGIVLPPAVVWG